MTGWAIDVAAAQGILDRIDTKIDEFDTAADAVSQAIEAASGVVSSTRTAAALAIVAEDPLRSDSDAAKAHATTAVEQTRLAIDSYVSGDLEMAASAQRLADQ